MKRYVFRLFSLLALILGFSLLLNIDNLTRFVFSQESLETPIEPAAMVKVRQAKVLTPEQMKQAEAALGPMSTEVFEVPFMSDNPVEYEAEKGAANSEAAVTAARPFAPEPLAPPTLRVVNFNGANQATTGIFPPDTHGAVGRSHFVEVVNSRIVVFNKSGTQLASTDLAAFFRASEFVFDPRVVYDRTWNRWVIVATRRSTSPTDTIRRFFLAVSTTGDPAGPYFTYFVNFNSDTFNNGDWWDFPQLGMDQDALIITGNIFDTPTGPFRFSAMMPIAKARVYNGLGFRAPVFTVPEFTLAAPILVNFDQNNNAYLVAASNFTTLTLYRASNLSNPSQATLVLQSDIDVPDYSSPPDAPQLATNQLLDTGDRRFANMSTQFGDSLWNVHTINGGGFATPKFYEIDTQGEGADTIKQQGTFFESSTSHDFNVSITANKLREAFVTWTTTDVSNSNVSLRHNARIRFSGRQPTDPPGVISAGSTLFTSPTALTSGNCNPCSDVQRWGDYSAVSLDPSASSTCAANRRAWIVNEKINSASVWGSRIARIGFCN